MQIGFSEGLGSRAMIACPEAAIPAPGQYLLAHRLGDQDAVAGAVLFRGGAYPIPYKKELPSFTAAPPVPDHWQPGDELLLRGPLGRGFSIPQGVSRLGLVALNHTTERLLPLAGEALNAGGEVAVFTDSALPRIPAQIEVNPLNALAEGVEWAGFLALDGTLKQLEGIIRLLGLGPEAPPPCPAQALLDIPMPCGGLAECGVCAVRAKRGFALACLDGPVFDWKQINLNG